MEGDEVDVSGGAVVGYVDAMEAVGGSLADVADAAGAAFGRAVGWSAGAESGTEACWVEGTSGVAHCDGAEECWVVWGSKGMESDAALADAAVEAAGPTYPEMTVMVLGTMSSAEDVAAAAAAEERAEVDWKHRAMCML